MVNGQCQFRTGDGLFRMKPSVGNVDDAAGGGPEQGSARICFHLTGIGVLCRGSGKYRRTGITVKHLDHLLPGDIVVGAEGGGARSGSDAGGVGPFYRFVVILVCRNVRKGKEDIRGGTAVSYCPAGKIPFFRLLVVFKAAVAGGNRCFTNRIFMI